jgi:hypothetical protein
MLRMFDIIKNVKITNTAVSKNDLQVQTEHVYTR